MKLRWLLVLTVALALFGAPVVSAQDAAGTCNLVSMFDVYAPATAPGAPNGVVYGLLVNLGGAADTLVGASSAVAEAVELHRSSVDDSGVMQMKPVEGGIPVGANDFVALEQGGLHIMLINLKAPLEVGASFDLTLTFATAGDVTISVPVRPLMDAGMAMGGMAMGEAATPEMPMDGMAMATPEMPMGGMAMATPETAMGGMAMADWGACAGMHIVGAWARPSLPGAPNTGAYALLLNLTASDDTLVSAATKITQATELHEMTMGANDVMEMRPVEGGIPVPAGGTARLQPGGLHVMLIGLTQELPAGSTVQITYTFASGYVVTLDVPVHAPDAGGMAMGGM